MGASLIQSKDPVPNPLARVINGLVCLQEKVPPARGEEQVDALSVHVFGQRALQPWRLSHQLDLGASSEASEATAVGTVGEYLEAAENEVLLRGEEEVHLRGAGGIVMGRVSQEHEPSHFLSPRSILELEPHRQGGPQVNHGRRKQEQPGLLKRQGEAGRPDQAPEEPHGCKTRSDQTRAPVCSSLPMYSA